MQKSDCRFVRKYGTEKLAYMAFDFKTRGVDVQKILLGKVNNLGESEKIVPR